VRFDKEFGKYTENLRICFEGLLLREKYKRSRIAISVCILQADGSVKSAVLNGITLALLDAGIEMKEINVAVSVGILPSATTTHVLSLDLTNSEENSSSARLTVSLLAKSNRVAFMEFESAKVNQADFAKLLKLAMQGCQLINAQVKDFVSKYYVKKMFCSR
jgi:exosome complex component RRP41